MRRFKKLVDNLEMNAKLYDALDLLKANAILGRKEEKKRTNPFVIVLAVIGAIATVAAIAYAVFRFMGQDAYDDFDEDYDDDYDDEEMDDEELDDWDNE